ncbi:MAG: efflux RND transporter periplasmic adaptor subunit [Mariprofundales bacterium]|nr:efflux RND transporter periplasmic adaptor subunit [Mariprofundales bacterium]
MTKRMIIMLLLVGMVFAAIIGYQMFSARMMKKYLASQGRPAATVTTMKAQRQSWQPQLHAIGTLRAIEGVEVSAEIAGVVKQIHFRSGDWVKQGDLLLEIDSIGDVARLQSLRANRKLAEINLGRDQSQFAIHAVSKSQLDAARAALTSSRALEAQQQDVVDKKHIRAPFAGRLGISEVNLGQFLKPAQNIVSLQNIRTLFVDFNLPQKYIGQLHAGQSFLITSNAHAQGNRGQISAIDTVVNRNTRNLLVEGMIDNANGGLLPGMFVNVALDVGSAQQQLTLPQTAVSYNAYGSTVFVVQQKKGREKPTAQQVFVKTGDRRGDQITVLSGIHQGDIVVTSGQMKLKNGTPLIINNKTLPANDAAPTPQES